MKESLLIKTLKNARMRISRRQVLKAGALGSFSLVLPWRFGARGAKAAESPFLEKFVDALPIPRVFDPVRTRIRDDGSSVKYYSVKMRQFKQQLHRDLPDTTVWGYGDKDGYSFPGPSFVTHQGDRVVVKWVNRLSSDPNASHYLKIDPSALAPNIHGATDNRKTVVHLHGGEVTQAVDGYPYDTFLPGERVQYKYDIIQRAATLWYHDHAVGNTRLNVYMGLAGAFIVRDELEEWLMDVGDLPQGPYEIPLVIQDRRFKKNGMLSYDTKFDDMYLGDAILVNGKVWPYLDVEQRMYRFRILNGSNSRTYTLQLGQGQSSTRPFFHQIGTDGGFLSAPVEMTSLTLTPGERADVIIDFNDFSIGDEVVLTNTAPSRMGEGGTIPDVMAFTVQNNASGTDTRLPISLDSDIETLAENEDTVYRDFEFEDEYDPAVRESKWEINRLGFDDITEEIRPGATEVWRFINKSEMIHPMHLHLVQFQVLSRHMSTEDSEGNMIGTGPNLVEANEAGWKDTVRVGSLEIVTVIARFPTQSQFIGFFPYHCHILEHEDHEMMRQFEVCNEGECTSDRI